ALLLSEKEDVTLWEYDKNNFEYLLKKRHPWFFPYIMLPEKVKITNSIKDLVHSDFYVVAVPSFAVRGLFKKLSRYIKKGIFISAVKGIEEKSMKRMSEVMKEEIKGIDVYVLSGPTHAEEVAKKLPTSCVIAGKNLRILKDIQNIFSRDYFRPYINRDIIGVEIAGSVKNVIAIASGICDGIGLGINSKAALITRGLAEIARFGIKLGAQRKTFMGLAGIGDLMVTCFSKYSRNRNLGELIGKGYKLDQALKKLKMTAEGVYTSKALRKVSKIYKIDMPISNEVYNVLFREKKPRVSLKDLMSRPLKDEFQEAK
ncbi:MAG: glycerol-3-phosphate dehydrogenase, partial [Caldiserica bacterium]